MAYFDFDVIVIGGGHAGVEAVFAAHHLGKKAVLITLNEKMIANTPCNPHIGGSAKGIVVREIDALGGMMGLFADHDPLQIKFLNTRKGPGVQCLRAQVDKKGYPAYVQKCLREAGIPIIEGMVSEILHDGRKIAGVLLTDGRTYRAPSVVLASGTYLESEIIRGSEKTPSGPDGEKASHGLSASLKGMGLSLIRLKTGTPPRLSKKTIDFSKAKLEEGMEGDLCFSFLTDANHLVSEQLPCHLIYTNEETERIIREHLDESAVTNGLIQAKGPRYCPSIESKILRFPNKERHQLFLEPETRDGDSIYLQGFSTGFPHERQVELVHTLPGLEKAEIIKDAYQIEYDALDSFQFDSSLAVKAYDGFYVAGQICGTSGYEEAAGLGLIAGINAVRYLEGLPPFILRRDEAYIGVMIDDLVTKGAEEPYRLLSSRAEYRLLLRHDNADFRLTELGGEIGLANSKRLSRFAERKERIEQAEAVLKETNIPPTEEARSYLSSLGYKDTLEGHRAIELLKRPYVTIDGLSPFLPALREIGLHEQDILTLETQIKYEGYINLAKKDAERSKKLEDTPLPDDFDYIHMDGLRLEARECLSKVAPKNVGQVSRLYGVNPSDVSILLLNLKKRGLL